MFNLIYILHVGMNFLKQFSLLVQKSKFVMADSVNGSFKWNAFMTIKYFTKTHSKMLENFNINNGFPVNFVQH